MLGYLCGELTFHQGRRNLEPLWENEPQAKGFAGCASRLLGYVFCADHASEGSYLRSSVTQSYIASEALINW